METSKTRTYSSQEVNRIIQRALQENERDGIGYEELLEIGRELGLAPQTIEAAIRKEDIEAGRQRAVENWRQSRKFGFHWHLWSFIIANIMLLLVNALVPGPWWFQWSVIGWGMGLAFHYQRVYFPTSRQIRKAVKNRLEFELP